LKGQIMMLILFMSVEKRLSERHSLNLTALYTPILELKILQIPWSDRIDYCRYNSYGVFKMVKKFRVKPLKNLLSCSIIILKSMISQFEFKRNVSILKLRIAILIIKMQIVQILRIIEKCLVFYSSLYAPDNGEFSGAFRFWKCTKSKEAFLANPQIDWSAIYQANQNQFWFEWNNYGLWTCKKYVLYEDQVEDQTAVATTNLNAVLSEHIVLNAGASLKSYNRIIFNSL
jgi:hypothetical protein